MTKKFAIISINDDRRNGFTFIEMLLSLALIGVIAAIAVPISQGLQVRNDLDLTVMTATQTLRRAKFLSEAVDHDASWGVMIEANSITLFEGTSFLNRNPSFDEAFALSSVITPSGLAEVVFAKVSGEPQSTGTIIFTSSANETRQITINAKGAIAY